MDQNSEALRRSIAESLKKVNRARRLRALTALALGVLLFSYSYVPVFLNALAGEKSFLHGPAFGVLSMLTIGYGIILLVFGVRARIFYDRHFRINFLRRILYFAVLIGCLVLIDSLLVTLFTVLGRQLSGRTL